MVLPIILMVVLRGFEDKKRLLIEQLLTESYSVIKIDKKIIEAYCRLYRKLKREGNLLPDAGLIIAATTIAHDLTLETNIDHFQRLTAFGLKLK